MTGALKTESCADFTAKLASREAVPGGGGAAALMGALGAALCAMAGNLTLGKPKYAAYEEELRRMTDRAEALRLRFLELIDKDAAAFAPLSRAYALDKSDPAYPETLRRATLGACGAVFELMENGCRAVELLEEMEQKGSRLLLSDVGCGALAARAALEAAAMNVLVNTRLLPEDPEARRLEEETETMLRGYAPRAQAVADRVLETMRRKNSG